MNNYYKVVNDFLTIAKQNPFIKGVEYGNIYEQHNSGNIEYNTFTLTQGENSSQTENEITYNFIAFVTDRLLEDKSNLLYVQSSCKTILDTILTTFKERHSGWSIDTETFSFWEEKFNDYCAGCFVNFSVTMPIEFSCVGVAGGDGNTIEITSNGTYDVTNYDTAIVNVNAAGAIDYYWIMPHNYGVPQINYSDNTTTLELKFRLNNTTNQSIYDDGYTSLIYEDNQYKARLNGGEWKETLIRETDAPETRVVKLTGTKLQIGYYLFDLEDGEHKWTYGQHMYIGKGENVGDIDVYYCKLYWDKGDFADYEPFVEKGETVLKDSVGGTVLSIKKDTFENHLNDVEQYLVTYVTDTKMVPTDNFKIKCKLRPYFPSKISYYSYFFLIPAENGATNNGSIWMLNSNKLGCAMNGRDGYLSNNTFAQGDILEFELNYGKTASTCTLWVNGEQRSVNTYPKYRQMTKSIMLGGSAFDAANYTYWYSFQMYDNDVLVFDAKPKRVGNTNNYILYDEISKRAVSTFIDDFNKLSEISTLSFDYDEPSDFQTLTVSNEEYKAVKPVLAKIRGEEIVDNEQRAVVE